jgi:hypothetical protein
VVQSPVLVGRDGELALIDKKLADAAAGAGQLLFVAGEAALARLDCSAQPPGAWASVWPQKSACRA